MPPNVPQNTTPPADAVWISSEEYERLRRQESVAAQATQQVVGSVADETKKRLQSRHRWQILIGVGLSIALFVSVSAGAAANALLVGIIVIFAGVSVYDLTRPKQYETVHGITVPKVSKYNPYKILAIVVFCITILPAILFFGFFFVMLSLGGGDMGS